MGIQIINERTDKLYSKEVISASVCDFYDIDDYISETFHKIMELKYNTNMVFDSGDDHISYIVDDVNDDETLKNILDDWYIFVLKYA